MATSSEDIDLLASGVFAHIRQNPINIPAEAPTDHNAKTKYFGPAPVDRDPTFTMGQAGAYRIKGIDDQMPPGGVYHAIAPMPIARTYLAGVPLPDKYTETEAKTMKFLDKNLYYIGNTAPDTTSDKMSADFQLQISGASAIRVDGPVHEGETMVFRAPTSQEVVDLTHGGTYLQKQNPSAPVVFALNQEYVSADFGELLNVVVEGTDMDDLTTLGHFKTKKETIIKQIVDNDKRKKKDFKNTVTRSKRRQIANVFSFIEHCLEVTNAWNNMATVYKTNKNAHGLHNTARAAFLDQLKITASNASAHYLDLKAHEIGRAATPSQAGGAVLSIMR